MKTPPQDDAVTPEELTALQALDAGQLRGAKCPRYVYMCTPSDVMSSSPKLSIESRPLRTRKSRGMATLFCVLLAVALFLVAFLNIYLKRYTTGLILYPGIVRGSSLQTDRPSFDEISPEHFRGYFVMHTNGIPRNEKIFCKMTEAAMSNASANLLRGKGNGRVLMNVTLSCREFFEQPAGQGSWIVSLYISRISSFQSGTVDLYTKCADAEEQKTKLILPWLMGYWPALRNDTADGPFPWPHPQPPKRRARLGNSCRANSGEIAEMAPYIQYELRRMAIAVAGIPHKDHPSAKWAEKYLWSSTPTGPAVMQLPSPKQGEPPLIPGIELDDAALHFRCGDLMGSISSGHGFMKFSAYSKIISPEVRSIGIVTNPFGPGGQSRGGAENRTDVKEACRIVAEGLHDFLAEKFPSARVSLRNNDNETIAMAYTRLIMANQTIVGMGVFGTFPAIATFGRGYIRYPDFRQATNHWAKPLSDMYDNIELFSEPARLMSGAASELQAAKKFTLMLEWFRNDTFRPI